jgi:hypothetical protein
MSWFSSTPKPPPLPQIRYHDRVKIVSGFYAGNTGKVIAEKKTEIWSHTTANYFTRTEYQVVIDRGPLTFFTRNQLEILPTKKVLREKK